MKRIFLILFATLYVFSAKAQSTVFTMASQNLYAEDVPQILEIVSENDLENISGQLLSVTWQKVEPANKPTPWRVAVCDNGGCYSPSLFYKTFDLTAGGSGNLDVHLQPQSTPGNATIRLILTNNLNAEVVNVDYTFNVTTTVGLQAYEVAKTKVFPTLTAGLVNISSDVEIAKVEVFNCLGGLVLSHKVQSKNTLFDLTSNARGNYIVKVYNSQNQVISTNKIVRK